MPAPESKEWGRQEALQHIQWPRTEENAVAHIYEHWSIHLPLLQIQKNEPVLPETHTKEIEYVQAK